jgi:chain length determinant protein (polysaccharide antigen chain regulator)
MQKIVLKVTPPPEKARGGRSLYSVDVESRTGELAAEWLQTFWHKYPKMQEML